MRATIVCLLVAMSAAQAQTALAGRIDSTSALKAALPDVG
jgi:hypothetical protein